MLVVYRKNKEMRKQASLLPLYLLLTCTVVCAGKELPLLSDVTAVVDKVFTYQISAANSDSKYNSVTEAGEERLPSWLSYDQTSGVLQGVASEEDIGTRILSADGDLFAITVQSNSQHEVAQPSHVDAESLICKPQDSITKVTVALNTDINSLIPPQRVKLITDFSDHLSLSEAHVSLRSEQLADVMDVSSALVYGLGDRKRKPSQLGSLLYWVVGCGAVKSHQMEILERLESSAKNGSLSQRIGSGVSSWQVTINKPSLPSKRRLKRQASPTHTPSPDPLPPTTSSSTRQVTPTATVAITESSSPPTKISTTIATTTKPTSLPPTTTKATTTTPTTTTPTTTTPTTTTPTTTTPTTTTTTSTTTTPTTTTTTPTTTTPTTTTSTTTTPTTTTTTPTTTTTTPTTTTPTTTTTAKLVRTKPTTEPTDPTTTVGMSSKSTLSRTGRSTASPSSSMPPHPPTPPPFPIFSTSLVPYTTTETASLPEVVTTAAPSTTSPPPPPPITAPPPTLNRRPVFNADFTGPVWLELTSGELFQWAIPATLFTDPDGDSISYSLFDMVTGMPSPWVTVDSSSNEIRALPLPQEVDTNKFVLRAMDTREAYTDVHVTLFVDAGSLAGITQEYKLDMGYPFTGSRGQLRELVFSLQEELKSDGKLKVLSVDKSLVELGISYKPSDSCPQQLNRADLDDLRELSPLNVKMFGEYQLVEIVDVRSIPLPPCRNTRPRVTHKKKVVKSFELDLLPVKGLLFEAKVPDNLFEDLEDINLKYMELSLETRGEGLTGTSWVYLDNVTNTLLGLPWDIAPASRFQYALTANDSGGMTASHDIEIRVVDTPASYEPTNLFTLILNENFSKFANNLYEQIRLYDRLNRVFGGDGEPSLLVRSITKGSVILSFNVIDTQATPRGKVDCSITQSYVDAMADSEGVGKQSFSSALLPFQVTGASFVPKGACKGVLQPLHIEFQDGAEALPDKEPPLNVVYIIVPVVVVIVVIVIIFIAVVMLNRKKRSGLEVSKSNGTYIEKGVPVVFDDDIKGLDENEQAVTEPLLEETKPKPPAYPQNGAGEIVPLTAAASADAEQRYPTPPVSEHDDTDR